MTLAHLLCLSLGWLIGAAMMYRAMRDYRTTLIVTMDPVTTRAVIREQMDADEQLDAAEENWLPGRQM